MHVEIGKVPLNLYLVRHGESEENVLTRKAKELGKMPELLRWPAMLGHAARLGSQRRPHTSKIRLTKRGRDQAIAAGKWMHDNTYCNNQSIKFHSSYVRAIETAGLLGLDGRWKEHFSLHERDWGHMDRVPLWTYFQFRELMKKTPVHFAPIHGESFVDLVRRVKAFIDTLARNYSNEDVVVVCHGEVMWAFRFILERMTVERFEELERSKNPHDRIHNCQILHYTRLTDPVDIVYGDRYEQFRSICPWDLSLSSNEWRPIERVTRSSEDLLAYAERHPHIL